MGDDAMLQRGGQDPYETKDGSLVTELVHPSFSGASGLSVAKAVVSVGGETALHRHQLSEEIYMFTGGSGRMALGDELLDVGAGDSVVIPPGTSHKLWNTHPEVLALLCICAPAYSHDDTELLG